MKNIAIIPARSGSKGIPDKNIKLLNNLPLMAYSIVEAVSSNWFDEVMVSTDSEKYAEIARTYGANVPFLRSNETATDTASSWDMVLEVLDGYRERGREYDSFCLLQPTSPLRTKDDITNAYRLYTIKKAFSVISMTELDHPLSWCGVIGADGSLDGFVDRNSIGQRQNQKKMFRPNGAIYIATVSEFFKEQFLYRSGSYAYVMPKERSVDIDTEMDFLFAEFLIETRRCFLWD